MNHVNHVLKLLPTLAGLLLGAASAHPVDMRAENWQSGGQLTFSEDAAHPHGVMAVRGDGARLAAADFGDGTIEYDVLEAPDNQGIPGIWFHQQGLEAAEHFYLRAGALCPGSNECIQYAPVSHGNDEWDTYPEFQASATVHASGWNHVKLVLSGRRMNVHVNGETKPSLAVGRLAGEAVSGGISLRSANTIDIAIDNKMPSTRHWGWAFAFRFDTLDGLENAVTMAVPPSSM